MSVCSVESAYQESRKSKKQIVKGSNGCLKRQNEITDNDEVWFQEEMRKSYINK